MDYIQSNSQESLLTTLKDITKNNEVSSNIVSEVSSSCSNNSLDFDKVANELVNAIKATAEIRNPRAFCNGVVNKIIKERKALFIKDWKKPCFTSLHKAFKDTGIDGTTGELFLVDSIEEHCLNKFHVSVEEMIWTNRAIIEYCKNKGIKTLKEFTELLLKLKLLSKCNVPLETLKKSAFEKGEEWDKTLLEMGEY